MLNFLSKITKLIYLHSLSLLLTAPPAPAYLYSNKYLNFDYGLTHPLRIWRLELANELISLCGLAQSFVEVYPANYEDLLLFHIIFKVFSLII